MNPAVPFDGAALLPPEEEGEEASATTLRESEEEVLTLKSGTPAQPVRQTGPYQLDVRHKIGLPIRWHLTSKCMPIRCEVDL